MTLSYFRYPCFCRLQGRIIPGLRESARQMPPGALQPPRAQRSWERGATCSPTARAGALGPCAAPPFTPGRTAVHPSSPQTRGQGASTRPLYSAPAVTRIRIHVRAGRSGMSVLTRSRYNSLL